MLNYYTTIILLSLAALLVLCVLVHENDRLKRPKKSVFYLTYLLIALASVAEWAGIQLSGNQSFPSWIILVIKCIDYTLTPIVSIALIKQMGIKNQWYKVLNGILVGNTVFQILSCFFGWMTRIDENNVYSHGPLYFIYMIVYLLVIVIVIIEFLIYGNSFSKQNRYSLYAIIGLVLTGIILQEGLGGQIRTAYLSVTFGAILMYIHYSEYSQIDAESRLNEQQQLLLSDSMTGLLSRYAYSKTLKYHEGEKLPDDFAAFSIDINGLKIANDTLGHAAGDELICGAAECIDKVFSPIGNCYRTGGDEFIVLALSDRKHADELLSQLSKATSSWSGSMIKKMSVSAGYALACDYGDISLEKLIIHADEVMYDEKNRYYRKAENDRRTSS